MTAFNEIWEANQSHLKNFIATKVPGKEVSDVLQNVSIELFNSLDKGKSITNLKNWLFQVTRNTIADHYKNKSKSLHAKSNFSTIIQKEYEPCICDIMEQIIESVLPPKYSTPLILSDIYKLQQQEIANRLDINYVNAKSRIQRARKKLKKVFEQTVDFTYNQKGEIVGGVLKANHNLPAELVQKVKQLQLED